MESLNTLTLIKRAVNDVVITWDKFNDSRYAPNNYLCLSNNTTSKLGSKLVSR